MHTYIGVSLKPNFMIPCCRELYFLIYAFSSITLKISNQNRRPIIFAFHLFGLKCCLHPNILC